MLSLGIRREDKNRWERRVPLCPEHVERLVKEYNVKVIIQPSKRRIFPDSQFIDAGALVQEDLSTADIIMGVKEVPLNSLIPNKTYLFFSHTHKGQPYNMSLFQEVLDKVRLRLNVHIYLFLENKV